MGMMGVMVRMMETAPEARRGVTMDPGEGRVYSGGEGWCKSLCPR